jgi:hypothetical protein
MVNVTLPDGSVREFESPVTVAQVAASIGAGLAKAALAGKVDGKLVDTSTDDGRATRDRYGHDEAPTSSVTTPRAWRRRQSRNSAPR